MSPVLSVHLTLLTAHCFQAELLVGKVSKQYSRPCGSERQLHDLHSTHTKGVCPTSAQETASPAFSFHPKRAVGPVLVCHRWIRHNKNLATGCMHPSQGTWPASSSRAMHSMTTGAHRRHNVPVCALECLDGLCAGHTSLGHDQLNVLRLHTRLIHLKPRGVQLLSMHGALKRLAASAMPHPQALPADPKPPRLVQLLDPGLVLPARHTHATSLLTNARLPAKCTCLALCLSLPIATSKGASRWSETRQILHTVLTLLLDIQLHLQHPTTALQAPHCHKPPLPSTARFAVPAPSSLACHQDPPCSVQVSSLAQKSKITEVPQSERGDYP